MTIYTEKMTCRQDTPVTYTITGATSTTVTKGDTWAWETMVCTKNATTTGVQETTSSTTVYTSFNNDAGNLFNGFLLFFISMYFVIWFFRKKK